MFIDFFYTLKDQGIPVSPTSFLTLHRALESGLVRTLNDFYTASRTILVKSERYFDLYDQVFAHYFQGADLPEPDEAILDDIAQAMLEEWLRDPKTLADAMGIDESELNKLSPEELIEYFKERLKDQDGRHDGGSKWIGTGGTSPWGIPVTIPAACGWGASRVTSRLSRWPWSDGTKTTPSRGP